MSVEASISRTYKTLYDVPIFDTPENPFVNPKLPFAPDSQGLFRNIEAILPAGSIVERVQDAAHGLFEITSRDYPSATPIYVPRAALAFCPDESYQAPVCPPAEVVLQSLQEQQGVKYYWGGNAPLGIPQMLKLYPHLQDIYQKDSHGPICRGVDCSGLLYFATNKFTPRNTSGLVSFGRQVQYDSKMPIKEVQDQIKPLDIVVWKGHVLVVLTKELLIESEELSGVKVSPFAERLIKARESTAKEGKEIFVRRWHPAYLDK